MVWPKGKRQGPEARNKMAQATRERWADPEYRKKVISAMKKTWRKKQETR